MDKSSTGPFLACQIDLRKHHDARICGSCISKRQIKRIVHITYSSLFDFLYSFSTFLFKELCKIGHFLIYTTIIIKYLLWAPSILRQDIQAI